VAKGSTRKQTRCLYWQQRKTLIPIKSVSILISNFNYAKYLLKAVTSALEQSHAHVEVIVVDDGSTDDS
jgi:cellulose synthase/poly-beta-1,6-N-acetylglucosamine synthase-like glycosyltransferase